MIIDDQHNQMASEEICPVEAKKHNPADEHDGCQTSSSPAWADGQQAVHREWCAGPSRPPRPSTVPPALKRTDRCRQQQNGVAVGCDREWEKEGFL